VDDIWYVKLDFYSDNFDFTLLCKRSDKIIDRVDMMNKIYITQCIDCDAWRPVNSYGTGVYCDDLQQAISDDTECFIPDNCPRLIKQRLEKDEDDGG